MAIFGDQWDYQCARCGSSLYWEICDYCAGKGGQDGYELMQEDPFLFDPDDVKVCDICDGKGGWFMCLSGQSWCKNHPLKGMESVNSGTPEYFEIKTD